MTEQMACSPSTLTHSKCISGLYPDSKVERFNVPKDKISWTSAYPEYLPNDYTSPVVKGQIWADEDEKYVNLFSFTLKFLSFTAESIQIIQISKSCEITTLKF